MKKFISLVVAAAAVGLTGGALLITQNQAIVSGSMTDLKFEFEPPPQNIVGAPPVFTATKETLKYLEGKKFRIAGDGSIQVVADK